MFTTKRQTYILVGMIGFWFLWFPTHLEFVKAEQTLDLKVDLFGYAISPENFSNPRENITKASGCIYQTSINKISLIVSTNCQNYSLLNEKFETTEIYWEGELMERIYYIHLPDISFFGEVHLYSEYSWINLAYDAGNFQINLDGCVAVGFDDFELKTDDRHSIADVQNKPGYRISMMKKLLLLQNEHNWNYYITTLQSPVINSNNILNISIKTRSTTNYGIIHECLDYPEESQYDDILDEWETYSQIDVGIHRYNPTESQIKCDLQYYTRDVYENQQLMSERNLLAYEMVADSETDETSWQLWGNKHWVTNHWEWDFYGEIFDNEIEDLWGAEIQLYNQVYVWYPTDCIILAYATYSWGETTSSNPDMGDSFVDYYADSFVGSITSISSSTTGDNSDDFWNALAYEGDDVEQATRDLCTAGSWTYNTDWKILGSATSTL